MVGRGCRHYTEAIRDYYGVRYPFSDKRLGYYEYLCPFCGYKNIRCVLMKRIVCDRCKRSFSV